MIEETDTEVISCVSVSPSSDKPSDNLAPLEDVNRKCNRVIESGSYLNCRRVCWKFNCSYFGKMTNAAKLAVCRAPMLVQTCSCHRSADLLEHEVFDVHAGLRTAGRSKSQRFLLKV